jgi:hypothetical protein
VGEYLMYLVPEAQISRWGSLHVKHSFHRPYLSLYTKVNPFHVNLRHPSQADRYLYDNQWLVLIDW